MVTLHIEKRNMTQKPALVRQNGKIPAVMYGRKETSTPITVDKREFEKIWRDAGESTVITLEGVEEPKEVLIHEITLNPLTENPDHIDFYVVEKGVKVTAPVQFEFIGEAPAIKNLGGTLVKVMHEIEVEALPKDLPHALTVDISTLETFESRIAIKDIVLPSGVEIHADPEEAIALIAQPQEEVEEAPLEEIDLSAIEVEKKGKKEEEGDAGAEEGAQES